MNVFDLIEKPAERVFHYIHDLAELKAAKSDPRYADIERRRGDTWPKVLLDDKLTMDDWEYQHEKVYELTPSVKFWHTLQLKAKEPRKWWGELKAMRLRATRGFDAYAIYDFHGWHTDMVIKALTEYNKVKHGHPAQMSEKQWDIIVQAMIDAFQAIEDADMAVDEAEMQKRVDYAFKLLSTYYLYLCD